MRFQQLWHSTCQHDCWALTLLVTLYAQSMRSFVILFCVQSCAELRSEAVDYFQQDMTGQLVSQAAETLALVVDITAGAQDLQAAKPLLIEVCNWCVAIIVKDGDLQPVLCEHCDKSGTAWSMILMSLRFMSALSRVWHAQRRCTQPWA